MEIAKPRPKKESNPVPLFTKPKIETKKIQPQQKQKPLEEKKELTIESFTEPKVKEQTKLREDVEIVVINGDEYINSKPPKCTTVYSASSYHDQQEKIFNVRNEKCLICGIRLDSNNPKTFFNCGHWLCTTCKLGKDFFCPICESYKKHDLSIDIGNSRDYSKKLEEYTGKNVNKLLRSKPLSSKQRLYLRFIGLIIDERNGASNILKLGKNIDDFIEKGFTLSQLRYNLFVTNKESLTGLGFRIRHLYEDKKKKFVDDVDCLVDYGITKDYIMERSKIEGNPFWIKTDPLLGSKFKIGCSVVERLFRNDFSLNDFIKLGWKSQDLIQQGVPANIYNGLIDDAVFNGMLYKDIETKFDIKPFHLEMFGCKYKTSLNNNEIVNAGRPQPLKPVGLDTYFKVKEYTANKMHK